MENIKFIKLPTEEQKETAFFDFMNTIEDTDIEDFRRVFESGVELVVKLNEEKVIMKTYDELGFSIDMIEVYKLITDSDVSDEIDELDSLDIYFTDIDFNADNAVTRNMNIYFNLSDGRSGTFEDNKISIDNKGRVYCNLVESPWEGGGVESEIEEILMKYVTKQKYLKI